MSQESKPESLPLPLLTDQVSSLSTTLDIPNQEVTTETTRLKGIFGQEAEVRISEVSYPVLDWKAEEEKNKKHSRALFWFFAILLATIFGLAIFS